MFHLSLLTWTWSSRSEIGKANMESLCCPSQWRDCLSSQLIFLMDEQEVELGRGPGRDYPQGVLWCTSSKPPGFAVIQTAQTFAEEGACHIFSMSCCLGTVHVPTASTLPCPPAVYQGVWHISLTSRNGFIGVFLAYTWELPGKYSLLFSPRAQRNVCFLSESNITYRYWVFLKLVN
jgi:hypothetical protein